jgi:hypothetical protein
MSQRAIQQAFLGHDDRCDIGPALFIAMPRYLVPWPAMQTMPTVPANRCGKIPAGSWNATGLP